VTIPAASRCRLWDSHPGSCRTPSASRLSRIRCQRKWLAPIAHRRVNRRRPSQKNGTRSKTLQPVLDPAPWQISPHSCPSGTSICVCNRPICAPWSFQPAVVVLVALQFACPTLLMVIGPESRLGGRSGDAGEHIGHRRHAVPAKVLHQRRKVVCRPPPRSVPSPRPDRPDHPFSRLAPHRATLIRQAPI